MCFARETPGWWFWWAQLDRPGLSWVVSGAHPAADEDGLSQASETILPSSSALSSSRQAWACSLGIFRGTRDHQKHTKVFFPACALSANISFAKASFKCSRLKGQRDRLWPLSKNSCNVRWLHDCREGGEGELQYNASTTTLRLILSDNIKNQNKPHNSDFLRGHCI